MIGSPIYTTSFDRNERQYTDRLACERPQDLCIIHALMHEITAVTLTCPLLIWIGSHTLGGALAFNIGLTLTYSAYAYVFHIAFDQLRPVQMVSNPGKAQ
jgi:uncharacterized membrane protein